MSFSGALAIALPELILAIGAMALLVTGAFKGDRSTALVSSGAGLVLVVAAAAACWGPMGAAFSGGFVADQLSAFAKVAIYLMSAIAILLGDRWLHRLKGAKFEYPVLILLAALGMGIMASAGDLISLYLGVELMSLATYVLAAFRRDDARSSEAGLKYFVLGALSSGLLLYGASLIYGFTGSIEFSRIVEIAGDGNVGVIFGLVFLICGLAFKMSAAPFHMWTPDVYEGAPTTVTAWMSSATKVAALLLTFRVMTTAFPHNQHLWGWAFAIIATISLAIGNFAALVQKNVKRILAYSAISQAGFMLIGLSTGTALGGRALMYYLIPYSASAFGSFAIVAARERELGVPVTLDNLAGFGWERPFLGVAMWFFVFGFAGLPL